jgi:hypothetical protein
MAFGGQQRPASGTDGAEHDPIADALSIALSGQAQAACDALFEQKQPDLAVLASLAGAYRLANRHLAAANATPYHQLYDTLRRNTDGAQAWGQAATLAAAQATDEGHAHRAAALSLATRRPHQAVAAYRRAGLWREALAVAAAHLLPADPAHAALRAAYAAHARSKGLFEIAAANFLAAGRLADAAAALLARGGAAAALAAAEVALRAQHAGRREGSLEEAARLLAIAGDALVQACRAAADRQQVERGVDLAQASLAAVLAQQQEEEDRAGGETEQAEQAACVVAAGAALQLAQSLFELAAAVAAAGSAPDAAAAVAPADAAAAARAAEASSVLRRCVSAARLEGREQLVLSQLQSLVGAASSGGTAQQQQEQQSGQEAEGGSGTAGPAAEEQSVAPAATLHPSIRCAVWLLIGSSSASAAAGEQRDAAARTASDAWSDLCAAVKEAAAAAVAEAAKRVSAAPRPAAPDLQRPLAGDAGGQAAAVGSQAADTHSAAAAADQVANLHPLSPQIRRYRYDRASLLALHDRCPGEEAAVASVRAALDRVGLLLHAS